MKKALSFIVLLLSSFFLIISCNSNDKSKKKETKTTQSETPEYFNLRPKLEKEYGYSHAVKIGDDLIISGAVSMDDSGIIIAPGNMEQQMKNCYSDLEKILQHYLTPKEIAIKYLVSDSKLADEINQLLSDKMDLTKIADTLLSAGKN